MRQAFSGSVTFDAAKLIRKAGPDPVITASGMWNEMAQFEWYCQKCKKFRPGSFTSATKPLAPGEDPLLDPRICCVPCVGR